METLSTKNAQLSAELTAREAQLDSKSHTNTRILQLRENPTSQYERTKLETLNLLKAENAALRSIQEGTTPAPPTVPRASVEVLRKELASVQKELADREKRLTRLKSIFSSKSLEFRQAVHSILGVLFDFMPNGRVRVSSALWSDDPEDGITFDGEMGTMKIAGEEFRKSIEPLVKTWVEERGEIPGLVASLVMDGWERRAMDQS